MLEPCNGQTVMKKGSGSSTVVNTQLVIPRLRVRILLLAPREETVKNVVPKHKLHLKSFITLGTGCTNLVNCFYVKIFCQFVFKTTGAILTYSARAFL